MKTTILFYPSVALCRISSTPTVARAADMTLSSSEILSLILLSVTLIAWCRIHILQKMFRQATYEADHDHVTGLPNRSAVERFLRTKSVDTIGLLDLDRFKDINDRFGHSIGDQFLNQIAARLDAGMKNHGIAARLGGDEFLLIWTSSARDPIQHAISILREAMRPIVLTELTLTPTASLGLARHGPHLHGRDLLAAADLAMYHAKNTDGNSLSVYRDPFPPPPADRRTHGRRGDPPVHQQPDPFALSERTPLMSTARSSTTASAHTDTAGITPQLPRQGLKTISSQATSAGALLVIGSLALIVVSVLVAPLWLSAHAVHAWSASTEGLAQTGPYPLLVVLAVNGTGFLCLVLAAVNISRGQRPGAAGTVMWICAAVSAVATWRHARSLTATDASWFLPLMSLFGPVVLHLFTPVLSGVTARAHPPVAHTDTRSVTKHRLQQWIPGVGSFTDSYGAYRTRLLLDLDSPMEALTTYHDLCPDGSWRVASALRRRRLSQRQASIPTSAPDPQKTDLPAAIMRQIPVDAGTFGRWRAAWKDMRELDATRGRPLTDNDLGELATRHGLTVRDLKKVRQAGPTGLLQSPIPPAVRLVQLAPLQT